MGLASIRNVNRYMQAIYTDLKAKGSTPLVLSTDSGAWLRYPSTVGGRVSQARLGN